MPAWDERHLRAAPDDQRHAVEQLARGQSPSAQRAGRVEDAEVGRSVTGASLVSTRTSDLKSV